VIGTQDRFHQCDAADQRLGKLCFCNLDQRTFS